MRTHGELLVFLCCLLACDLESEAASRSADPGVCAPLPCPSGAPWNPSTCSCEAPMNVATDGGASDGGASDGGACVVLPCPMSASWNAETCRCETTCALEPQVSRASGANALDCGNLPADATSTMREQARRCVLDAVAAKRPFRLIQQQHGTDSNLAAAVASAGGDSLISLFHYDSDPSGGNRVGAIIHERTCRTLGLDGECDDRSGNFCLSCAEPIEASIVCQGRSGSSQGCRGPGNYEAGKEGSYLPCCAGLREVSQQRAGESEGERVCLDLPLRVYACVEGSCGDGRCEEAEAVACGCALDCPSAALGELNPYRICDGSEGIRLALTNAGGHLDQAHYFTNPHGFRFLYVTGTCRFVAGTEHNSLHGWSVGTLSAEDARALGQMLGLSALAGLEYVDPQSCPDASVLSLATADGYADCTCGCDDVAPPSVEHAIAASDAALTWLRARAMPASGPVELLAVEEDAPFPLPDRVLSWPFTWSIGEIAISGAQFYAAPATRAPQRVLAGDEAQTARSLRDQAIAQDEWERAIHIVEGEQSYTLYLRDQIDAAMEQAIDAFEREHNPGMPKPLSQCQGGAVPDVDFDSADVYGGTLVARLQPGIACGLHLCWDGSFDESNPALATLRAKRDHQPRTCLGSAGQSLQTDLGPLQDAFRRAYPGTPVEIDLALSGYSGELQLREP